MHKFKYLKISNTKKIRYLSNNYTKNLYIVFLHGFMSDLTGDKPKTLQKYCRKKKNWISWLRIFWTRQIFRQIYKW